MLFQPMNILLKVNSISFNSFSTYCERLSDHDLITIHLKSENGQIPEVRDLEAAEFLL